MLWAFPIFFEAVANDRHMGVRRREDVDDVRLCFCKHLPMIGEPASGVEAFGYEAVVRRGQVVGM